MVAIYGHPQSSTRYFFNGLRLKTSANRASVMNRGKYDTSCDEFRVKTAIRTASSRKYISYLGTEKSSRCVVKSDTV